MIHLVEVHLNHKAYHVVGGDMKEKIRAKWREAKTRSRAKQRLDGICVDCPRPAVKDRIRCAEHLKIQSAIVIEHKKNKVKRGICKNCTKEATHGQFCLTHRLKDRIHSRSHKDKRRATGLCSTCGIPLNPDCDTGFKLCITCRGRPACRSYHKDYRQIITST